MARSAAAFSDWTHVATVRATRKGQTLELSTGTEIGGKGLDGRNWHRIEKAGVGKWSCDCLAQRFSRGSRGEKKPCKHLIFLFDGARQMKLAGQLRTAEIVMTTDIIIVRPEAF